MPLKHYLYTLAGEFDFKDRFGLADATPLFTRICAAYHLGQLRSYVFNPYGFQDINCVITTTTGRYFVKIFSVEKNRSAVDEYVALMDTVGRSSVSFPTLYKGPQGLVYSTEHENKPLFLCVQHYIDGSNFHEKGINPTTADLKTIAIQAAYFNKIQYKPRYIELDTWATLKFNEMFPIKKKALHGEELTLVTPLVEEFSHIQTASLPHCLVHGDIIRTNVVKDVDGKIWIIDLGVTMHQPRIIELAVLAHDLFLDTTSIDRTRRLRTLLLQYYQKITKVTQQEIAVLPLLTKITHAMYLLSAAYMERFLKRPNAETTFWLHQSKEALSKIEQSAWNEF